VMDQCFIPSDNPWQKAFTISLVMGEQIWTHIFPHTFVMGSWLGFMEPNVCTLLNILRHQ
jgi:hypothetical protein